ncbi:MAG: type VI secretion system baseplate subunit TssE [Paludibacterium sp.]|uniref:type VI secretion system baseplate subunit TssE n=1 Tax=Paludibacterium sp. TaxID=1917523 RepID=UPI0025CC5333|nr:type VI secretion system baseplate subunit TssE [Paludibacterium sp.]MBV8048540.1 type VI secretion system baseplate subunit TssE [Paludibacterium sp.]MBV8649240.1 type VI secretion system baseplate subunit TssE [Paludibacterium sp.]
MEYVSRHTTVQPSIIDRLLDDAPDNPQRDAVQYFDVPRLKAALARDLEALLNTRFADPDGSLADFPEAEHSMLQFGIPDLSGLSLLNPEHRETLRDRLRRAIERHEPRLGGVRVSLDAPRELERHLRFRVDAILKVHPHRPPVMFDATLQLSSNVYRVSGQ